MLRVLKYGNIRVPAGGNIINASKCARLQTIDEMFEDRHYPNVRSSTFVTTFFMWVFENTNGRVRYFR